MMKKSQVMARPLDRKKVPNVVVVGSVACGKSTVGFQLAHLLGMGAMDVDKRIELIQGKSIEMIFQEEGEESFREMETQVISGIANIMNHVVITGAGAVERQENWDHLRTIGPVVWLATPLSESVRRLAMKPDEMRSRPLLADAVSIEDRKEREDFLMGKMSDLFDRRKDAYHKADVTVVSSYSTPEVCAQMIKQKLMMNGMDT